MTEEEMQERITMYQDGLQESYNKRMKLEKRIRELQTENRALQERAQMRQELVEQYEQDIARLRQKARELEAYKQPIDFPKLREGVAHVDNSLSDFLKDSIKRAAARP